MNEIDITPSWTAVMPYMIYILTQGTEEGKQEVAKELIRLARIVDQNNERLRKL